MSLNSDSGSPDGQNFLPSKGAAGFANTANQFLEKAMPLLAPSGVILGVLLPGFFLGLRPYAPWLFGSITLAGALKLRARELGRAAASPLPLVLFFFAAHILMPLIVLCLSSLIFRNDPDTVSGYVLLYSVPAAVTGFIWVSIFKGDSAMSLAIILIDTLLSPLTTPGAIKLLLRTSIKLDMTGMAVSLIFMVAIPTVVGVVLNEASRGKIPAVIGPWLNVFSKVCIILVIGANAAAVAPQIRFDNPRLWIIVAVCVSFSLMGFICGKFTSLAARLDREKQVTLFYAVGLRNTSAAMTLAIQFLPPAAALPAVLGIMFQQSTAAVMGRLLLGKTAAAVSKSGSSGV